MSMYCAQCQEAARNEGCTVRGVCGKQESTSNLQDVLIYAAQGLATAVNMLHRSVADGEGRSDSAGNGTSNPNIDSITINAGRALFKALFTTITNVNFDDSRVADVTFAILREKEAVLHALREATPPADDLRGRLPGRPARATWRRSTR